MSANLSVHLSLEQLRKQAKEYRDNVRAGHFKALRSAQLHTRWSDVPLNSPDWDTFTLADAQLVIARTQGFPSWPRLREFVDMLARCGRSPRRHPGASGGLADDFLHLACLTHCDSWNVHAGEEHDDLRRQSVARQILAAHPELASASIHTAAAVGDLATARSLLASDSTLANQPGGPHGWPPLLYLSFSRLNSTEPEHSTLEVARLLLANGADPNAGYLSERSIPVTALSGAFRGERDPVNQPAHQHSLPLARLLLDHGADPNDEQALRNACGHPHDDDTGLALLLEHGLGLPFDGPWHTWLERYVDDPAPTPVRLVQAELRYSAQWNQTGRVRLLLRRCAETGIDIDTAGSPHGRDFRDPAYKLAAVCGNTEVVDLLARAGAKPPSLEPIHEFVSACLRADRPAVKRLLTADPSLAERALNGEAGPEPLHLAIALGRPEAVAVLVSLGFPVNGDWCGWGTPLHTAALSGQLDIVRHLVEHGADTAALCPDDDDPTAEFIPHDRTPLGWARYNHHHEVVAYLSRSPLA